VTKTLVRPSDASPPARRTAGDWVRFALRGIGQTMITLGLVILLFVAYELWVSNFFADRANHALAQKLETKWAHGDNPLLPLPGEHVSSIPLGIGIANLYIPRFGPDYHWTILQGTTLAVLADGPGHYVGTALPGQIGNFAVAGHRVGKGEPFLNLDHLRAGDAVIVETKPDWYVYKVKGLDHGLTIPDRDGVAGREIVDPNDGAVVLPYPDHPGRRPFERLMTMTTCTPKFTATQRLIIHAKLAEKVPVLMHNGHRLERMPPGIRLLYTEVRT
jgi:sortase A